MDISVIVLSSVLLLIVAAGLAESLALRKARGRLDTVVHVNGTRGKSSVTRLAAAALREAGIVTFAKTTGTLPRLIYPDGSEVPVHRRGRPNIIEQEQTIRHAAECGARALVIECMALQPLLQSISELKIVRATHSVITNARPDHLDVMGPDARGVAQALSGMIGVRGKLFTCEHEHLEVLRAAAKDRHSEVVAVTAESIASVTSEDLAGFRYTEHAENVALVLSLCEDLGVPRDVALRGMYKAEPDPGAMTVHHLDFFGRKLVFYNGFAANDPVSTEQLWRLAVRQQSQTTNKVAVFNCRADRTDRSAQLGTALPGWPQPDWVVLMGGGTQVFARVAARAGFDTSRVIFAEGLSVEEIFERLVEIAGPSAMLMGMGNIGGQGLDLARYFKNRALLQAPPSGVIT